MNIDTHSLISPLTMDKKLCDITVSKGDKHFIIQKDNKCKFVIYPAKKHTNNIFV